MSILSVKDFAIAQKIALHRRAIHCAIYCIVLTFLVTFAQKGPAAAIGSVFNHKMQVLFLGTEWCVRTCFSDTRNVYNHFIMYRLHIASIAQERNDIINRIETLSVLKIFVRCREKLRSGRHFMQ